MQLLRKGRKMANGLTTTGWILTIVSVIVLIASAVVIVISFSGVSDNDMEVVATEIDFSSRGTRSYQYRIESEDASNTIEVIINSRSSSSIPVTVQLIDPLGSIVYDERRSTRATFTIDVTSDFSDYWELVIQFDDDQTTLSAVSVEVSADPLMSDGTLTLCCLGMTLPIIGIIMLVVGLIILVVGYKKTTKDERAKSRQQLPPDYYSRPTTYDQRAQTQNLYGNRQQSYNPSSPARPGTAFKTPQQNYDPRPPPVRSGNVYDPPQQSYDPSPPPARTGTVQKDPNPYYKGHEDPRTAPKPPGDFDYRDDW